ncbi:glycosyltransferase [Acinetobacter sp. V91_7]|uniref:glycosyltransferase n=1 Tax=unclassified Acinetobacter TaxID=196816 RepID=UPI00287EB2F5|nr:MULTISPECIES: glycosyltransferase [unclassified Acinetobacter]MDS7935004.1 glycosyltransferase [Acinetobacter sp. V91_4B]MDS7963321.1 glycosyltransferase [Acinetobacter sp. V91_7]MDS8027238.1 glycosyltransferase [Acinetobacter sp. V91_13]
MRVFLIAEFFPPMNMIGAVRPYQLAKFLVEKGYEVTVFTSYEDNHSSKDYLVDFNGIEVISVAPSKMVSILDYENPQANKLKILKQISRNILYPDHFIVKKNNYLKEINQYIEKNGIPEIMFSMGLPFSLHCVASSIKIKFPEIKWIADNRDLWATTTYRRMPMFLRSFDKKYEIKTFQKADLVLVVTNHMKSAMEQYLKNKISVVRNGFLEDSVNSSTTIGKNFVYTGGLYGGLRDLTPLLEALCEIQSTQTLEFYGSDKNVVEDYIQSYPQLRINNNSKLPRDKILEIQNNAEYLIIALGKSAFEKGVLTGKFYEYIRARRPIIALCDEDGELAYLINKYNLGVATRDSKKIAKFILNNQQQYTSVPHELTSNYQFENLLTILNESD